MARTESAASIKRRSPHKGDRSRQLPREGSQLRAFYDALKHAQRNETFWPRMPSDDVQKIASHIYKLHIFYGLDIVTVRRADANRRISQKAIVGWYISGEWHGAEYVRYPIPGLEDQP